MDIEEFKFPNSTRIIAMNNDNSNDVAKLSSMIVKKDVDVTVLFEISKENAEVVHNAIPK